MREVGKFSVTRHGSDQCKQGPIPEQRLFLLYRVIGGNALMAADLCHIRVKACKIPPSVVITLEDLRVIKNNHIEVCRGVIRACRDNRCELFICGVTSMNQAALELAGALAGLDHSKIFKCFADLMKNCSDGPDGGKPRKAGRYTNTQKATQIAAKKPPSKSVNMPRSTMITRENY
jgi:hypothetical protein